MLKFISFLSLVLLVSCSSNRIDINVDEFKAQMNDKDVVILDVRTPEETKDGKIEGAIEIDVKSDGFKQKISELEKDKTYLVYCRSGRRSVKACHIMENEGFEKLYNLEGGYNLWKTKNN